MLRYFKQKFRGCFRPRSPHHPSMRRLRFADDLPIQYRYYIPQFVLTIRSRPEAFGYTSSLVLDTYAERLYLRLMEEGVRFPLKVNIHAYAKDILAVQYKDTINDQIEEVVLQPGYARYPKTPYKETWFMDTLDVLLQDKRLQKTEEK